MDIEALAPHTGTRLAELGFLLLVLVGIWLIVAFRLERVRMIVAGLGLAAAGVLLIIATHWGQFGHL